MGKKKKNKHSKNAKQQHKNGKKNQPSSQPVAKNSHSKKTSQDQSKVVTRELVATVEQLKDTTTTFSKKLEEIIQESSDKRLFAKAKTLFMGFPGGLTRGEGLLIKIFRVIKKLFLTFLFICLFVSIFVSVELFAEGKIIPRTTLSRSDFSFQSLDQAKEKIAQKIEVFNANPQSFLLNGEQISLTPSELGLSIDLEKTFSTIPTFNFEQNFFWDILGAFFVEKKITISYEINPEKIHSLLDQKFNLAGLRAQNAAFYFDKKKLLISEERSGQTLNQEEMIGQLKQNILGLNSSPIQLTLISEQPEVTKADLERSRSNLISSLENTMVFWYSNLTWKVKLIDHLDKIDFKKVDGEVVIDPTGKFHQKYLLPEIFAKIEKKTSDIKIYYDDKHQIVFEGDAIDGIKIKKSEFHKAISMAIDGLQPDIEVPVEMTRAKVETDEELAALGIKEMIGVGHTAFAGSPTNRRHNISTGMKKLNGTIIKPGEVFSFVDYLGPVEKSTGYKLELVIKAEGTVPEYGGGICQVSSTFFKAALLSGLPIIERSPHSYAVAYYAQIDGYGLDATIYPGVKDLRFLNDTGYGILVQNVIEGDHAYVKFYGTSDGRDARLEKYARFNYRGPGGTEIINTKSLPTGERKQIEAAHGGFDAYWQRIIEYPDGTFKEEDINSSYRSTATKILVGE